MKNNTRTHSDSEDEEFDVSVRLEMRYAEEDAPCAPESPKVGVTQKYHGWRSMRARALATNGRPLCAGSGAACEGDALATSAIFSNQILTKCVPEDGSPGHNFREISPPTRASLRTSLFPRKDDTAAEKKRQDLIQHLHKSLHEYQEQQGKHLTMYQFLKKRQHVQRIKQANGNVFVTARVNTSSGGGGSGKAHAKAKATMKFHDLEDLRQQSTLLKHHHHHQRKPSHATTVAEALYDVTCARRAPFHYRVASEHSQDGASHSFYEYQTNFPLRFYALREGSSGSVLGTAHEGEWGSTSTSSCAKQNANVAGNSGGEDACGVRQQSSQSPTWYQSYIKVLQERRTRECEKVSPFVVVLPPKTANSGLGVGGISGTAQQQFGAPNTNNFQQGEVRCQTQSSVLRQKHIQFSARNESVRSSVPESSPRADVSKLGLEEFVLHGGVRGAHAANLKGSANAQFFADGACEKAADQLSGSGGEDVSTSSSLKEAVRPSPNKKRRLLVQRARQVTAM